jgi:hypothetical protein
MRRWRRSLPTLVLERWRQPTVEGSAEKAQNRPRPGNGKGAAVEDPSQGSLRGRGRSLRHIGDPRRTFAHRAAG